MVFSHHLAKLYVFAALLACSRRAEPETMSPALTPDDAPVTIESHDDTAPSTAQTVTAPEPPASNVEELYIDGVHLYLNPDTCHLKATFVEQEQEHHFDFPGTCHFSPSRSGEPWIVATDQGKTVLVESWVPTKDGLCDTALQLVIITEHGPELSSQIQRVSGCGPGPWDEMMYHAMATQRTRLGSP